MMKGSSPSVWGSLADSCGRRRLADSLSAFAAFAAFAALGTLSAAPAGGPSVPVAEAVALAQEQLQIRGLQGSVYIESVTLRSASILSSAKQWTILWSEPLPASQGRVEVGVEVDMKGNVVRLLKKAATGVKS